MRLTILIARIKVIKTSKMSFYHEDIIQMEPIYTPDNIPTHFQSSSSTLQFFDIDLEKHKTDNIEQIEVTEKDSEWIKLQNTPRHVKNRDSPNFRKFWFTIFITTASVLFGLYHFFRIPTIQIGKFYVPESSAGLQFNTTDAGRVRVEVGVDFRVISKNYFDFYCNEISIFGFLLDDSGVKIDDLNAKGTLKDINFPAYSKTKNTMVFII
jgi:hypothetical protein